MPWAPLKSAKEHLADDRDAVAPVKRNSSDVEYPGDGGVRAETNQINDDAPENRDPNGIYWSSSQRVDLGPDTGERDESVTREGEESASERLLLDVTISAKLRIRRRGISVQEEH